MPISIQKISETNLQDVNCCDGAFTIDSRLALQAEDGIISYTIVPAPLRQKNYPPEEIDFASYLHNPDQIIYLAYVDGQRAGQTVLRTRWNGFAYVEDIRVAPRFRREGVGTALMAQAVAWARARGKPGIMLETQDVNVGACRFYESCGYVLGGFDRYLYANFPENKREIALYWYLLFEDQA